MPATRSNVPARRSSRTPNPVGRHRPAPIIQDDADVIILSSDDEPARPTKAPRKTSRQRGKARYVPVGEVVEITSEEECGSGSPQKAGTSSSIAELKKRLSMVEKENSQVRRECSELRAARKADLAKLALDASQIEDIITCEICALRMWDPYTLPCGHTFCRSCLEDWFSTTLAQHMTTHPNYNVNPPYPAHLRGLPHHLRQRAQLEFALMQPPLPPYTCPTCREEVKTKPAESFALKTIVRTVANAMGETSPRKVPAFRRKGPNGISEGPWDGFFPMAVLR